MPCLGLFTRFRKLSCESSSALPSRRRSGRRAQPPWASPSLHKISLTRRSIRRDTREERAQTWTLYGRSHCTASRDLRPLARDEGALQLRANTEADIDDAFTSVLQQRAGMLVIGGVSVRATCSSLAQATSNSQATARTMGPMKSPMMPWARVPPIVPTKMTGIGVVIPCAKITGLKTLSRRL